MKYKMIMLIIFVLSISMVGCEKQAPEEPAKTIVEDAYPEPIEQAPAQEQEDEGYPVESAYPVEEIMDPADDAYPIEEEPSDYNQGPEFRIDLPVRSGDTVVTGTGPAGVPINLLDISQVDVILGETVIEDDGTFTFDLKNPLDGGHSVGLQLGDIEGTDLNPDDFLYSPTYYERPLIGILFDIAIVD